MNRDHTNELLRTRWALTDQRFNDATVDAWHTVLTDTSYEDAQQALADLVRAGARTVTVGELVAATRTKTIVERERHAARQPPPPPVSPNHPAARHAFERGYLEQTGRPYDWTRGNPV